MPSLTQRAVSEALGTAFLLAAVVGSGIMAEQLAGGNGALACWGFVSVSIGAASVLPAADASPQDLTETTDASLYEAK
jgi:glycerol uptake facilitator-like aquaporin